MNLRAAPLLLFLAALSAMPASPARPIRHGRSIAVIRVTRPVLMRNPSILPPAPESNNTHPVVRGTLHEAQPLQQSAPRVKPLRPVFPWWFRRRHMAAPQLTVA